jgi:hypothetical protein
MTLSNIQPITWQKVYKSWQKAEVNNDLWQKRGFSSWKKWRNTYVFSLGLNKLKWQIGELKNPKDILHFYGGPFKAWKKYYYKNKNTLTFKELSKLKKIKENKKNLSIQKNLPKKIILIAIKRKNKIIIIEGMHRCCALMLLLKNKKKINSRIYLALAKYKNNKLPILGQLS